MTKTFEFTIEDIKAIFEAGIRRGSEEATAFEWGSSASCKTFDECIYTFYDIINKGKSWDADDIVSFDEIRKWFK